MVKYSSLIIFLLLFISNTGCTYDNPDWQKVYLEENKYIKVPSEWIVTYKDENIFITDKNLEEDFKVYLMCTDPYYIDFFKEENFKKTLPNKEYKGYEFINENIEFSYSNSSAIGKVKFKEGKEIKIINSIHFLLSEGESVFIAYDNLITDSMAKKIALSYSYD